MDKISVDRAFKLHPLLRKDALEVLDWAWKRGIKLRYTQTLRTFEEQAILYNQGRTSASKKKGEKVVTRAQAGQSFHNYGLALDIALISQDGKSLVWDLKYDGPDGGSKSDWMEVIENFKARGWVWGGDFKSIVDYPHVEKTFNLTWQQALLKRHDNKVDEEGYILIS